MSKNVVRIAVNDCKASPLCYFCRLRSEKQT